MTIDGVGKRKVVLLEFNSTLLEYEEQMEDVIIHEFAHAIAGEKDIQEKFHSHLWKEIAIALGGTGDIKIKGL
jgi:predicted SprT family Zn-dependent metalloprotease